jgi:hypothetical protein
MPIATVYTRDTAASEGHWHPVEQSHHACRPGVKGPAHHALGEEGARKHCKIASRKRHCEHAPPAGGSAFAIGTPAIGY